MIKLKLDHQNTYGKNLLYIIGTIYFSHRCHKEKSAVQVDVSPPQFSTVKGQETDS
jgi:hypothetical protein